MANEPATTGAAAPPGPDSPTVQGDAVQGDAVNGDALPLDVARLVREHQTGVWRYLRVLGCPAAEADDLTQDTFLAVLTKPFQDYNRQATAAYLRQVARNLFLSGRRRAVATTELDEAEAAWLRWAAKDDGQELMDALRACLQKLTDRARQALDLRFGRQASRADIATALELSEDGAKNLLQRAKQQLRECIEKNLAGERRGP
ncbi:MAG TPA: sigma-70 family RNA polymerase sigma factor [Pirellulales bacterium]|nr:sigma-70 family RNA polymerase sigma factor [Pirellulales bacterium]